MKHTRATRRRATARLLAALPLVFGVVAPANGAPGDTTLVSVQGDSARIYRKAMSADGRYVVYYNGDDALMVRDRQTGVLERIDLTPGGAPAECCDQAIASISSNGRFVAFVSESSNLVADDTNDRSDVFVRDLQLNSTERVSVTTAGAQLAGSNGSGDPAISGDGRYVAFATSTQSGNVVYLRDRQMATTRIVVPQRASDLALSDDGRFLAFISNAALVPEDTNGKADAYVWDRIGSVIERVSVSSEGAQANGASYATTISADGHYVAFYSDASNLVAVDSNKAKDVFLRDRWNARTERIWTKTKASVATGPPALSADGRYVAFFTDSSLVQGDQNRDVDFYVRDRATGGTEVVSITTEGLFGWSSDGSPSISADGSVVAFRCWFPPRESFLDRLVYVHEIGGAGPLVTPFTLLPKLLEFGNQTVGTSRTLYFQLHNTGTAPLVVQQIAQYAGDLSQFPNSSAVACGTLSPGAGCRIPVTFRPSSTGFKKLTISVEAGNRVVRLRKATGTGVNPP
jgi:Tol biopolymer transport system component